MNMWRYLTICGFCVLLGLGYACGQSNLSVKGAGFFQNRSLKSRLAFLHDIPPGETAVLDAAMLEDSAFLLLEQLKREGYLLPQIEATMTTGESKTVARWESDYSIQLDAGFVADTAVFRIRTGVLYYYENVKVEGVSALEERELRRFFIPGGVLLSGKQARVFTYENFDRRVGRVLRALDGMGYRDVRVVSRSVKKNAETGAVSVELEIDQGARYFVGDVEVSRVRDGVTEVEQVAPDAPKALTREWEQAQRTYYRNEAFAAGYPDATVVLELEPGGDALDGECVRNVRLLADWGEAVTLSGIRFEGDASTKRSVLKRQLDFSEGDSLDRLKTSEAGRRLMGLGIYKDVDVALRPVSGSEREVIYTLEPGIRKELKLLAGWGSYEQARGGFKWEHRNPFGRAHRYGVVAKQSLKASHVEAEYGVPQVFGGQASLYTNTQYSYREELSYTRTTQGGLVGISNTSADGVRVSAEYGYFQERADRDDELGFASKEDATVASIKLGVTYDRRDDFLAPSSGYSAFASFKVADRFLGGSVNFQKIEAGGTYHFALGESTLVHLGLKGGAVFSFGGAETNIPFNERFFSGGENSVRGYREGEASPVDADGDEVGAESYALANFELEQRVYSNFSTILFWDSVLHSREGFFRRGGEILYSVGVGLRYQTAVGPVRLEYGHNLNPRSGDPDGSFHFSIGFPF